MENEHGFSLVQIDYEKLTLKIKLLLLIVEIFIFKLISQFIHTFIHFYFELMNLSFLFWAKQTQVC